MEKKCTLKDTNLPFLIRLRILNKEQLVEGNWMNIQPWSTEDPNLYVARLELKDPEGKTVQSRETRIGFRTIEFFPQDGVYLNGTKLVVKGVNRHSFFRRWRSCYQCGYEPSGCLAGKRNEYECGPFTLSA